jgi:hypothetical protein
VERCGRALELAIGTGRVAVPLAEAGVPVAVLENAARHADSTDHVSVYRRS